MTTAIVTVSPPQADADAAHVNTLAIQNYKMQIGIDFLTLGSLLKINRDKGYFKILGHDTFESYLGSPEISLSRSMVFGLIQVFELYVEKLAVDARLLGTIGIGKLLVVAPAVELDVDHWLTTAAELSRSDLKSEVAQALGRDEVEKPRHGDPRANLRPFEGPWQTFVKQHSCVVCGDGPVDPHHFPVTRGAGKSDFENCVIPLCRKCHAEYHQDPKEWTWTYRHHWGLFLFNAIFCKDVYLNDLVDPVAEGSIGPTVGLPPEVVESVVEHSEVVGSVVGKLATPRFPSLPPDTLSSSPKKEKTRKDTEKRRERQEKIKVIDASAPLRLEDEEGHPLKPLWEGDSPGTGPALAFSKFGDSLSPAQRLPDGGK